MANLRDLRLPIPPAVPALERSTLLCTLAANELNDLLRTTPCQVPEEAGRVALLCTHLRPHLDEYMAMLLFRSVLPEAQRTLPCEESVINHATKDTALQERWAQAAVFGMGGVQNGGAHPLLLFDEHVTTGERKHASSSVALVVERLFGHKRLPKAVYQCIREIDMVDGSGGAHPKHLANYVLRLHDGYKSLGSPGISRQAAIEACITAFLRANACGIAFWQDRFWRERAIDAVNIHAKTSQLRHQNGFEQALSQLLHNIRSFRQPAFPAMPNETSGRRFQYLLLPYAAALCPLVWDDLAWPVLSLLWDARLVTQMQYTYVMQTLEAHFGDEPDDSDAETAIGRIIFRNVRTPVGNAAMTPWIVEIQPKPGLCNVRQALLTFVRRHHAENGLLLLRNPTTRTLVISRGAGIPLEQWKALVAWLVDHEGSSDDLGTPGCWHVVRNAQGVPADFLLNGNAAHRYVPPTSLTVDQLAAWIQAHPCRNDAASWPYK